MSITRYEGPDEQLSERTLALWERQANTLAKSPVVPEHFRNKPDEILIAYFGLHDIGIRPGPNTLQKCYVIKGKPGYMAQLQIAVAHRHGWDIRPVEGRCDEKAATVRIRRAGSEEPWENVTFTWDDAVRAKLPEQNPTYHKFPAAMLFARATTKAIGQYCPEVLLGIDAASDRAAEAAAAHMERRAVTPPTELDRPAAPAEREPEGDGADAAAGEPDPADAPPPPDALADLDADGVRELLAGRGIKLGTALRAARTLAESSGLDVPNSVEDLRPELLRAVLQHLEGGS